MKVDLPFNIEYLLFYELAGQNKVNPNDKSLIQILDSIIDKVAIKKINFT